LCIKLVICKSLYYDVLSEKHQISSIGLYGVETWTFPKVFQKYVENLEMW